MGSHYYLVSMPYNPGFIGFYEIRSNLISFPFHRIQYSLDYMPWDPGNDSYDGGGGGYGEAGDGG